MKRCKSEQEKYELPLFPSRFTHIRNCFGLLEHNRKHSRQKIYHTGKQCSEELHTVFFFHLAFQAVACELSVQIKS